MRGRKGSRNKGNREDKGSTCRKNVSISGILVGVLLTHVLRNNPSKHFQLFFASVGKVRNSYTVGQLSLPGIGLENITGFTTNDIGDTVQDALVQAAVAVGNIELAENVEAENEDNGNERPLQVVQIGANDASFHGNDMVVQKLLQNNNTRSVLVEANPQVYPRLLETIQRVFNNSDGRIVPVNSLVCPRGAGVKFYVVRTEKLKQEFTIVPHWVMYQISSLSKESIVAGVNHFFRLSNRRDLVEEDFIDVQNIPCTPFAEILSNNGIAPATVDVLAVDIEGHDVSVVTEALRIPDFFPSMITFEVKSYANGTRELLAQLEERGYTHDCPEWKQRGDRQLCQPAEDVTAVLKSSQRYAYLSTILNL